MVVRMQVMQKVSLDVIMKVMSHPEGLYQVSGFDDNIPVTPHVSRSLVPYKASHLWPWPN